MKKRLYEVFNLKGQALIESVVVILLISTLLSGFFVIIYKSILVIWIEYNLSQALNCENSKILQTKKYLIERTNLSNSKLRESDEGNLNITKIKTNAHRKNRNCLVNARSNIQKITTWEKFDLSRSKLNGRYEVKVKWNESKFLTIKGYKENPQAKALSL